MDTRNAFCLSEEDAEWSLQIRGKTGENIRLDIDCLQCFCTIHPKRIISEIFRLYSSDRDPFKKSIEIRDAGMLDIDVFFCRQSPHNYEGS